MIIHNRIESNHNPKIKLVKSLADNKGRTESGLFTVEGYINILEALNAGFVPEMVFVSNKIRENDKEYLSQIENLLPDSLARHHFYEVSDLVFINMTDSVTPQGITAIFRQFVCSLQEIMEGANYLLLLDEVKDPGNLATIIRTADAANFGGVVMTSDCTDVFSPKAVRASMGSLFHTKHAYIPKESEKIKKSLELIKNNGFQIAAAHTYANNSLYNVEFPWKVIFVIGNETKGIRDEILNISDIKFRIPMPGKAESLNAAVSSAVIMFEMVRRNNKVF